MTGPEDELNEVNKKSTDDGTPVGEADREADLRRSGADDAVDHDASGGTGVDMPESWDTGDSAAVEDGESIGAADRDADIDRSR